MVKHDTWIKDSKQQIKELIKYKSTSSEWYSLTGVYYAKLIFVISLIKTASINIPWRIQQSNNRDKRERNFFLAPSHVLCVVGIEL